MRKPIWMTIALAFIAPACGDDNVAAPGPGPGGGSSPPSKSPWVWQNPLPQANGYIGLEVLPGGRVASLSLNEAMITSDDGETWERLDVDHATYYDVNRRDDIVSVLTHERVFVSTDGGNSWRRTARHGLPENPFGLSGLGVAFRDADHGVVVGIGGSIATTTDGGATWTRRFSNTVATLLKVEFLDAQTLIAAEVPSQGETAVVRSTDGGVTWQRLTLGTSAFARALDITDGIIRLLLSSGILVISNDGGDTWSTVDTRINHYDIDFLDAVNGVAVGGNGQVQLTTNGGQQWTNAGALPDAPLLQAVCMVSETEIYVGAVKGKIYRTTDGGSTWTPLLKGFTLDLCSVSFATPDVGIAVGPMLDLGIFTFCGIFTTGDGGATWTQQSIGSFTDCQSGDLNAVCMVDAQRAVAVGDGGMVWTTSDAGVTWTQRDVGITDDLFDVDFADDERGLIVGDNGRKRITSDGGVTWSAGVAGTNTTERINAVSMASRNVAMLAGENSVVRRTTNGGQTWAIISGLPADDIGDIVMLDDATAVARTRGIFEFEVVRTTDGGVSWDSQIIDGTNNGSRAMAFGTPTHGYMLASTNDFSYVYVTEDGGITWEASQPVAQTGLGGVAAIGDDFATVVGFGGMILRTDTGGR